MTDYQFHVATFLTILSMAGVVIWTMLLIGSKVSRALGKFETVLKNFPPQRLVWKPCLWQVRRVVNEGICGRFRLQPKRGSFQAKQFFFCTKAAAVTSESSVCSQYSVARNNDSKWIVMIRLTNGAEGIRAANGLGDVAIRAGFTVGNAQQRLPAIFLKLRSNQVEFTRENTQFTAEVAFELRNVRLKTFT
jgi:hypothetical protein